MFQEISIHLQGVSIQTGLVDRHDLVRSCVGVLCDRSEKGWRYYYDKNNVEGRTCPQCGSSQTETDEVLTEKVDVPYATFSEWKQLTEKQKREKLYSHAEQKIKAWEMQK